MSRIKGIDHVVVFGIRYFVIEFLRHRFNTTFFSRDKYIVLDEYENMLRFAIGESNTKHLNRLRDLGYLPIHVKALNEGVLCPLKTPVLTITNTHPDFYWLPNFLETLLSNTLWHPMTTATLAFSFRQLLHNYASLTSDMPEFVKFQGHDFSMRGQTSIESCEASGGAHLTSFIGTDTIPAIYFLKKYYGKIPEDELIAASVPATEHSIQSFGGKYNEFDTYKRMLTQVYPKGILSIVSDTWDYWRVLTEILPQLKSYIMKRDGKLVIRPDSGDPVNILCGDKTSNVMAVKKGSVQLLWEIFGGVTNSKGFKQLDPHIGLIYGDSITLERCETICARLKEQGFASTNVVFGIGSYSYQWVTRDTFGFAMKATYGVVDGKPMEVYKDPATDKDTNKKSAKGLLRVNKDLSLSECVTLQQEKEGELRTVFIDGKVNYDYQKNNTLSKIRERIDSEIEKAIDAAWENNSCRK